ncbi:hypothetical protein BJ964_007613 [Actinoplanes lobatus]|uniref:Uncharacterized protein n=1 Tax=Actinoplanes lobatus TaxID=113568 RepID=A0A7W7MK72_9ACTN|nr:hypothetical protein [Actinoplanes lobatus]
MENRVFGVALVEDGEIYALRAFLPVPVELAGF